MAENDNPLSETSDQESSIYDEHLDNPFLGVAEDTSNGDIHNSNSIRMSSPRTVAQQNDHPIRYAFAQAFGERGADSNANVIEDADMISAVRFNSNSDMVATGDRGGRIVILKRVNRKESRRRNSPTITINNGHSHHSLPNRRPRSHQDDEIDDDHETNPDIRHSSFDTPEYRFWTQFQSHEPEFDYLKSMEIEEKINQIRWCRQVSGAQRLIATNDKTIKLWRVYEKEVKTIATMNPQSLLTNSSGNHRDFLQSSNSSSRFSAFGTQSQPNTQRNSFHSDCTQLRIPRMEVRGTVITATPRRTFPNAHAYHINSISLNSDEETFLSADDLRVNLWNLDVDGRGFNILDIKPDNMENLSEVITSAEFHPRHCHLFVHSSSRGIVKMCDLRTSALCDSWARKYVEPEDRRRTPSSFFSEIIGSISDVKFSPDGRYFLARDYMNLQLWDINMETSPILTIPVHEHLQARLCDLHENDCIFDKFQCCFSADGGSLLTGSYNSLFQSYSAFTGVGTAVEASVDYVSGLSGRQHFSPEGLHENLIAVSSAAELVNPRRRIMHLDASPTEQIAAVAAGPALYLYYGAGH